MTTPTHNLAPWQLDLLWLFAARDDGKGVSTISIRAAALGKQYSSIVHDIIALEEAGMLETSDCHLYSLTPSGRAALRAVIDGKAETWHHASSKK